MLRSKKWMVLGLLAVGLHQIGFQHGLESAEKKNGAAKVESIGGGLSRITLTPKAAERLDIQTVQVKEESRGGESRKMVPYAAVFYDPKGVAWTYTKSAPLTFVRKKVVIDRIDGDMAVLIEGPQSGTEVVTIGVIELYGAETGIGK